MDMKNWVNDLKSGKIKKAMPILSFPSVQLLGIDVLKLISDSDLQAKGMKMIADRADTLAAVGMMDLSVESEAFGSAIRFSEVEVPTVTGHLISSMEDAKALKVPEIGAGRTGTYTEAIRKAAGMIKDRPVFGGTIGPFSLTGRLLDVSEAMIYCYEDPEMVHIVLEKATDFIIKYIEAFKLAGANGIVVAEPLAGLLSPGLNDEFSVKYMKRIVDTVQTDDFVVIYHNCGNAVPDLIHQIVTIKATAYHLGNAVSMKQVLDLVPSDIVLMGNVSPTEIRNGTPESVRGLTLKVLKECGEYPNFVPSSGCDIPPMSSWANIDAFLDTVKNYYSGYGVTLAPELNLHHSMVK